MLIHLVFRGLALWNTVGVPLLFIYRRTLSQYA